MIYITDGCILKLLYRFFPCRVKYDYIRKHFLHHISTRNQQRVLICYVYISLGVLSGVESNGSSD